MESSTRNQTNIPEWFKHRKNRFPASLCNWFGGNDPKISNGFRIIIFMIMRNRRLIKSCNSNFHMGVIPNQLQ